MLQSVKLPNPAAGINDVAPLRTDAPPFCSHSFRETLGRFRELERQGFAVDLFEFKTNTIGGRSLYAVAHTEYQARQHFLRVYLLNSRRMSSADLIDKLAAEAAAATVGSN